MIIESKWKTFAINQVLSSWSSGLSTDALFDLIEQTPDEEIQALFDENQVIVWRQFEMTPIMDVVSQIAELATRAQQTAKNEEPSDDTENEGEATNASRASWAEVAINAFAEVTGMDTAGEDLETTIGDLLADLMHFCTRNSIDFDEALRSGIDLFEAELAEEAES